VILIIFNESYEFYLLNYVIGCTYIPIKTCSMSIKTKADVALRW
jgi:hypothetical protein